MRLNFGTRWRALLDRSHPSWKRVCSGVQGACPQRTCGPFGVSEAVALFRKESAGWPCSRTVVVHTWPSSRWQLYVGCSVRCRNGTLGLQFLRDLKRPSLASPVMFSIFNCGVIGAARPSRRLLTLAKESLQE